MWEVKLLKDMSVADFYYLLKNTARKSPLYNERIKDDYCSTLDELIFGKKGYKGHLHLRKDGDKVVLYWDNRTTRLSKENFGKATLLVETTLNELEKGGFVKVLSKEISFVDNGSERIWKAMKKAMEKLMD